jgi:hypothetical protein
MRRQSHHHRPCCFVVILVTFLLCVILVSHSLTLNSSSMTTTAGRTILNRVTPDQVALEIKDPVDPTALEQAKAILADLKRPDGRVSSSSYSKSPKSLAM